MSLVASRYSRQRTLLKKLDSASEVAINCLLAVDQSSSCVRLLGTPWTAAHQVSLSLVYLTRDQTAHGLKQR